MKTLTIEQKAKSDARKDRFKQMAKDLAAMTDEQRLELSMQIGEVQTIEGRSLSGHNCHLIAMQRPSATLVGGFRQWLNAGRCVRKGETGLMIWVPCSKKSENPITGQPETGTYFATGTVFDVSQTDEVTA